MLTHIHGSFPFRIKPTSPEQPFSHPVSKELQWEAGNTVCYLQYDFCSPFPSHFSEGRKCALKPRSLNALYTLTIR